MVLNRYARATGSMKRGNTNINRSSAGKGTPSVCKWVNSSLLTTLPLLLIFIASCSRPAPQYQDHYNIPGGAWSSAFRPEFKFNIADTAAAYQLFLLIRHTDAYPFSNIWINMDSRGPKDTSFRKLRVEVPLAAVSGQWLGRGMGEIWEQRVAINSLQNPAFFPHSGTYTVRLTQDMRRDPLPEVLTIGYRIEKLPPYKKQQ
jgi:gliding motility-associated lipoprotein GldH